MPIDSLPFVDRAGLFLKDGRPYPGLESALVTFKAASLDELEAAVVDGVLKPLDVVKCRGGGSVRKPGRLALYLTRLRGEVQQEMDDLSRQVEGLEEQGTVDSMRATMGMGPAPEGHS